MNRIIIACRTLEKEVLAAMESSACQDPVIWLEAGGHNIPKKRRTQLESALAQCDGFDTVLLAMTFCGNSLVGINSGSHRLVLPRFDDCIPLLLGSKDRDVDSYYLSEGWLSGKDNLLAEYERSVLKFGKTRADRIFSAMLHNYRRLVWLADDHSPDAPNAVQHFSAQFGLSLVTERKNSEQLLKLIGGNWDTDFLVIPPNTEITPDMRSGGIRHA